MTNQQQDCTRRDTLDTQARQEHDDDNNAAADDTYMHFLRTTWHYKPEDHMLQKHTLYQQPCSYTQAYNFRS
jgi:hypothetical protein